jgi:hypothetical protein
MWKYTTALCGIGGTFVGGEVAVGEGSGYYGEE